MQIAYCPAQETLITGYRGFIGSRLLARFPVDGIEIMPLEDVKQVKTVIHLACRIGNTHNDLIDNIALDTTIFEYCKTQQAPLVYISGNNVYPFQLNCLPKSAYHYHDYYAASKITGEHLLQHFYAIPHVILRVGDVFGEQQKHGNFFKAIEQSIKTQQPLVLIGDGDKIRSYIYISDLINLLMFYIHHPQAIQQQIYHVCYQQPLSLAQILHTVATYTGLAIEKRPAPQAAEPSLPDIRTMKYTPILNFEYEFTMLSALKHYCALIQEQVSA